MKPFDLEAAKRGEPLMFGNGKRAFWVGFNTFDEQTPVVVTTELGIILQRTEQGYSLVPDDSDERLGRLGGRACLFEYEESLAPIATNAAPVIPLDLLQLTVREGAA